MLALKVYTVFVLIISTISFSYLFGNLNPDGLSINRSNTRRRSYESEFVFIYFVLFERMHLHINTDDGLKLNVKH